MDKTIINERYDYLSPKDRRWGLHLCGVGTRLVPPHSPYQIHEDGAPYQWKQGRTLRDYSLVYITQGSGTFRVRRSRALPVKAGDVLLILPGLWHDYRPDPETGWKEYWIMFNGKAAEHLVSQLALPQRCPIFHYGVNESLHLLFTRMLEVAASMPPQADVIHTGLVLQLAATIQSRIQLLRERGDRDESFVQQAKQRMTEAPEKPVEMRVLARELGVSYSHFRRVFKTSTGMPPQQYLLDLRIIQAKQLMEAPGVKLSDVARRAGFSDAYYFSRIFKQRTGITPSEWRR